jgi:hypothetical protein
MQVQVQVWVTCIASCACTVAAEPRQWLTGILLCMVAAVVCAWQVWDCMVRSRVCRRSSSLLAHLLLPAPPPSPEHTNAHTCTRHEQLRVSLSLVVSLR